LSQNTFMPLAWDNAPSLSSAMNRFVCTFLFMQDLQTKPIGTV